MTPHLIDALTHPVVVALLVALGALGLISEAREPGLSPPGGAGVLALGAVVLSALARDPSGWPGLLLLAVGCAAAGAGVRRRAAPPSGAGVLVAAAGVAWLLVGGDASPLRVAMAGATVASSLLLVAVAAWALWWRFPPPRRPRHVGWALSGPEEAPAPHRSGHPLAIGSLGRVATRLEPAGEVVVGGERLAAVCEGSWIAEGVAVRVTGSGGGRVVVEPAEG